MSYPPFGITRKFARFHEICNFVLQVIPWDGELHPVGVPTAILRGSKIHGIFPVKLILALDVIIVQSMSGCRYTYNMKFSFIRDLQEDIFAHFHENMQFFIIGDSDHGALHVVGIPTVSLSTKIVIYNLNFLRSDGSYR